MAEDAGHSGPSVHQDGEELMRFPAAVHSGGGGLLETLPRSVVLPMPVPAGIDGSGASPATRDSVEFDAASAGRIPPARTVVDAGGGDALMMGDIERLIQEGQRDAVLARGTVGETGSRLLMLPGQVLPAEPDAIRGHGTHVRPHDGAVAASVGGFLGRVGKLVSVHSARQKYRGEVGDVIVGRVAAILQKSWRVEINAAQHGSLQLSAVNLPGGVLRRRTTSDQLQMRELFAENDVIVAEVQQVHHDGGLALHTRSLKYGRMGAGLLVSVRAALIRRTKNQFHQFPFSVDIIVGMNGLIWVGPRFTNGDNGNNATASGFSEELTPAAQVHQDVSADVRRRISRVRACILILAREHLPIFPDAIGAVYERSIQHEVDVADLLRMSAASVLTNDLLR